MDLLCESVTASLLKCQAQYDIISGRYGIMLGLNAIIFGISLLLLHLGYDERLDFKKILFGFGLCANLIALTLLIR